MSNTCAWCETPKALGPVCPSCGADYAKAEAIKLHGKVIPETEVPDDAVQRIELNRTPKQQDFVKDPELENKICIAAMPLMLLGACLVQVTGVFSSLQRIVFGMPLHELGHAMTSWLLGFNAIPTFWKTITGQTRGFICPFLLFLAIGLLANYGRKSRQPFWIVLAVALWVIQIIGISAFDSVTMSMLITFGGDAMGMILATALMTTFYLGKETQLYKGAVRWGFLFIGAAALMDMFMSWWQGQYDIASIGYGTTGGMYTDAYLLVNQYGWTWNQMISRHLSVGYACMTVLLVVYVLGIRQSKQWLVERKRAERLENLRDKSGYSDT